MSVYADIQSTKFTNKSRCPHSSVCNYLWFSPTSHGEFSFIGDILAFTLPVSLFIFFSLTSYNPYCLCFCTFGHTSDLVRALSLLYSSTAKRQVIWRPLLTCGSVQWVSLDCYAPLLLLIGILTSGLYLLAFCRFWSYTWFYPLMQICCCTSHLCLCFVHFCLTYMCTALLRTFMLCHVNTISLFFPPCLMQAVFTCVYSIILHT